MSKENEEKFIVPEKLNNLNSALEGLPGASEIMASLGEEGVKNGAIKKEGDAKPAEVKAPEKKEDNTAKDIILEFNKDEFVESLSESEKESFSKMNDDEQAEFISSKEEVEESDETNPILIGVKKGDSEKDSVSTIKDFKGIQEKAKSVFGINKMKDASDFDKIFKVGEKFRQEAAQVPELKEKLEKFENIFTEMPEDLLEATKAFFNGDNNYASKITNKPKFDFSKTVEKQDKKELVNFYFPGKFTDEDFKEDVPSPALEIATSASTDKYNIDKQKLQELSVREVENAKNRKVVRETSAANSLKTLKTSFPNMDDNSMKTIKKVLDSGDINSLFFNKDGSYKPEAANSLMMAMFGGDAIKKLMKIAERKGESKNNEEILNRGDKKPKESRGNSASNAENDVKVQKGVNALVGGLGKKKTY